MLLKTLQRFSRRQYVLGALLLLLFASILGYGRAAMIWLLLLLPAAGFFAWVARQRQHHGVTDREMEQVAYSFLAGIFPVSVMAVALQTVLAALWALACFYDQRAALWPQLEALLDASGNVTATAATPSPRHASRFADLALRVHVDKTVGYFVFLLAMAFCVAALVEELLKLWIVQGACYCDCSCGCGTGCRSSGRSGASCCAKRRTSTPMFAAIKQQQQQRRQRRLLGGTRGGLCHPSRLLFAHKRHSSHGFVVFMAVVAGALGFSLLENAVYTFSVHGDSDRALTALVRGAVSSSLHCICGGITGVRVASALQALRAGGGSSASASVSASASESAAAELGSWRAKARVVFPAVLVHGAFDAQIFFFAALTTPEMLAAHPQGYGVVLPGIVSVAILVFAFLYMRRSLHAMEETMHDARYIQVAVDLESGRRLSGLVSPGRATFASDDEDEFDMFDDDLDEEEEEGLIVRTAPGGGHKALGV